MWIVPSSTRSAYAQASACSMKALQPDFDTWVSTAAASSTRSGKHTLAASWRLAWKKAPWLQRLYGAAISQSSQPESFAAWWTASLLASRARTSALPGAGPGSTAPALACSSTSSTLPTIAVRGACFWRTSQASLLPPPPLWTRPKANSLSARPPESWENWPTAGGMRNTSLFQHPTWVPAMDAAAGSALPGGVWTTPDGCSGARDMSKIDPELQKRADTKRTTGLPTEVAMWLTPHGMSGMDKNGKPGAGGEFAKQASQWATPTSSDNANRTTQVAPSHGVTHGLVLAGQACSWPTPAARDAKGPNSQAHVTTNGTGRMHMDPLANFVAFSPLVRQIPDGQPSSLQTPSLRRHLNPLFGSWLMGWLSTWTIAEPHASSALATVLWRRRLDAQLLCCLRAQDFMPDNPPAQSHRAQPATKTIAETEPA
jgi:hypothetical protein